MTLGACVVANEGASVKDALLKARIDGKSWKQIGEEFGYGSPGAARTAFKKITGFTNFKVKGSKLKYMLDNELLDDLKKAVPKKPPVSATGPSAPSTSAQATAGTQGTIGNQAAVLGDDVAQVMQKAGNNGITVDGTVQKIQFNLANNQNEIAKSFELLDDTLEHMGWVDEPGKVKALLDDIQTGKYYSDITKKHGISFADVDGMFWSDTLQTAFDKGDSVAKAVWESYKKKPTSEYGFKAVQDLVWNSKKVGMTASEIADATGVDEAVVNLIFKNKWTLPQKGSKTYVGYNSPTTSSFNSQPTASKLVGESNNFKDMTKADSEKWIQSYGTSDLSPDQYQAVRSYTGSGYRTYNGYLRGGSYGTPGSSTEKTVQQIRSSMRPAPNDVTVYRGVGSDAFPKGIPEVGDAYMDRGFLSTSYGGKSAFGGDYRLIIDVPAGTPSRAVQNLSLHSSEREVILVDSLKMIVTGVKKGTGYGNPTEVYLKVVSQ